MTTYYTSNDLLVGFDATSAGSVPAGWTAVSGSWSVGTTNTVNGHAHSFACTSAQDGQVALCSGIAAAADMDLVYCQKYPSNSAIMSPIVRADAGYNNCYLGAFAIQSGQPTQVVLNFFKRVGGAYSLLTNPIASIASSSANLMIRMQCLGSTIRAKVWSEGSPEPAGWSVSASDGSVTAAGFAGFYNAENGGPANGTVISVCDVALSSVAANYVTVNTPSNQTAGAGFPLTGTYGGSAPGAIDVSFDGGSTWAALTSFSSSSNAWSGGATAPSSNGLYYALVRDHNTTVNTNPSGAFSVTGAVGPSITIYTPATQLAGQSFTVSGTYSGAVPTGLNYAFDAGSFIPASNLTIAGGNWSFLVTAPAYGSHTISVQEANAPAVTATSSSFNVAVAPNDTHFRYSPLNWTVTAAAASTINAGAYFSILFTGTTCALNFNAAHMCAPASQIWWRIDGPEGVWTQANVAATVTCAVPASTSGNADIPYHLLEVVVKSTTETANRWNNVGSATGTAVIFTGLMVANGAALMAPLAAAKSILCYGDSVTEGVRTVGESAANDTDRNDAMSGWAFQLGKLLGAEVTVVGFGGTGLSAAGSGNVPALGASYNNLYLGQPRTFTPAPNLIVINIGTNDGGNNTVPAMTGVLNGLIAVCPGVPIAVLRPFDGNQAANLQAAIAACSNPAGCHYVDTTSFFNTAYGADGQGLHPSGPNNLGLVAPQVAAVLRPLLYPAGIAAPMFRGGFQRGLLG